MNNTNTLENNIYHLHKSKLREDLFIARQIIESLGSNMIFAMLGVNECYAVKDGLVLQFEARGKNPHIGAVLIKLNALDLYDMNLGYIINKDNTNEFCTVKEINGLYNDMLIGTFEKETGLYLHF